MTEDLADIPPGATIVHEPHGFIHLRECRADDLMVVNAARVSYAKESKWEYGFAPDDSREVWSSNLNKADAGLINFLIKNRHGTPFEQTFFTFHVRAPIFLFREWHRHRIGVSINEESGRYVQLRPDFYLPDDEHVRVQAGKPGNYFYEAAHEPIQHRTRDRMRISYEEAYAAYEALLEDGVAKELARAVLPVGIYSQMLWTCNARSLMHFLSLRNHKRALSELRDYAAVMEQMFTEKMPVTAAAFAANGRVAP